MEGFPNTLSTQSALVSLSAHLMESEEYSPEQALNDAISILRLPGLPEGSEIKAAVLKGLRQ